MQKYNWSKKTFQSIDWISHDKSIKTTRYSQKRFITRFIHHILPVGKMNFISCHRCPYCDIPQNQTTAHDHFIQCNYLRKEKKNWIETLRRTLSKSFTPPNLRDAILDRVHNYYDSNLRDTNKVAFDENHSYDSRSDSAERNRYPHDKRRVIDQESIATSEDKESTSESSNESSQPTSTRNLISRSAPNSSASEGEYYDLESKSTTVKSDRTILESLHQDLTLPQKKDNIPSPISLQMRGDPASIASTENPITNSEAAESTSTTSNDSNQIKPRRKLTSRRAFQSSESDEDCYEFASTSTMENSDQLLIEPFRQDLSLRKTRYTCPSPISLQMRDDPTGITSTTKPTPLLIEPFHQDLTIPKQQNDRTTPTSKHARGGKILSLKPPEPTMNQDSSEG